MPFFLTLTMPGASIVSPEAFRYAWKRLGQRLKTDYPQSSAVWRKELQDRKSGDWRGIVLPHYHAMVWGMEQRIPFRAFSGQWVKVEPEAGQWRVTVFHLANGRKEIAESVLERGQDRINEYFGRLWYEFVGSGELAHFKVNSHPSCCEAVKFAEGVRRYAAKYMAKVEAGSGSEYARGRYWGVWNRDVLPFAERVAVRGSVDEVMQMIRAAKRYVAKKDKAQRVKRSQFRALNAYNLTAAGRWTKVGRPVRLGHSTINAFVDNPAEFLRLWEWIQKDKT